MFRSLAAGQNGQLFVLCSRRSCTARRVRRGRPSLHGGGRRARVSPEARRVVLGASKSLPFRPFQVFLMFFFYLVPKLHQIIHIRYHNIYFETPLQGRGNLPIFQVSLSSDTFCRGPRSRPSISGGASGGAVPKACPRAPRRERRPSIGSRPWGPLGILEL